MRILLVNKFLRPVGGAETVFFNEWRWLEAAGHEVIPFGMAHPANVDSPYRHFWLDEVDYGRPTPSQLARFIWSGKAAEKLANLVAATRPDIAHLHNIYHQLTPSLLPVLSQANIPIVLTIHDYKLVCPNYRLYTQGQLCQRCLSGRTWPAFRYRCHKDSWLASALVALESGLHRHWQAYGLVDRFIAPSRFGQEMLIRGGYPAGQITHLPHPITAPAQPNGPTAGGPVLFVGRLEPEKGVSLVLEAAGRLPYIPFWLVGDGSLPGRTNLPNVTFLGRVTPAGLAPLRQQASLELVPSLWYELFGLTALEGMAAGLPILASNLGALPEIVVNGETGWLLPAGDGAAWASTIDHLWSDPLLGQEMGTAGHKRARELFRPEHHLQALQNLYHTQLRVKNSSLGTHHS